MKSFLIVTALLLVPSLALAYDHEWSNHYEGIAGGLETNSVATCQVAQQRAHIQADKDNCKYPFLNDQGHQIGQVERCNCQCSDSYCICTDKLDVYCVVKDK